MPRAPGVCVCVFWWIIRVPYTPPQTHTHLFQLEHWAPDRLSTGGTLNTRTVPTAAVGLCSPSEPPWALLMTSPPWGPDWICCVFTPKGPLIPPLVPKTWPSGAPSKTVKRVQSVLWSSGVPQVFAGLITHFQLPFPPFLRYSQVQCKKEATFIFINTTIIPSNNYNNNLMIDFRCSCRGDQFLGKPGSLGAWGWMPPDLKSAWGTWENDVVWQMICKLTVT